MATEIRATTETYVVRGESFQIQATGRFDTQTNQPVFDETLDNLATTKAFDAYRAAHQLMTVARIKQLRANLGLSQRDFATLLGWSPTTVATYETGALPTRANNTTLLALEAAPQIAQQLFRVNQHLSKQGAQALRHRLAQPTVTPQATFEAGLQQLFAPTDQSIYAGYRTFDLKRLAKMVAYFAAHVPQLSKTKLNKLLFYADFTYFGNNTVSISGVAYEHRRFGPVPKNDNLLYATLAHAGDIQIRECLHDQQPQEYFESPRADGPALLSPAELATLRATVTHFQAFNAQVISQQSHREDAWRLTQDRQTISYDYAATLSTVVNH